LVATADIPAESIVLIEGRLDAGDVPSFLHPRHASEIPPCVMGFPLRLVPQSLFRWSPELMRSLRISLNAFGPLSLYAVGSAANHACYPNARRFTNEDGISVLVTREPVATGEEITLAYSEEVLAQPRWQRQLELFWRYGFWCRCDRCAGMKTGRKEDRLATYRASLSDRDAVIRETAIHVESSEVGREPFGTSSSERGLRQRRDQLLPLVALQTAPALLLTAAPLMLQSS
jgi:hypothetical protein